MVSPHDPIVDDMSSSLQQNWATTSSPLDSPNVIHRYKSSHDSSRRNSLVSWQGNMLGDPSVPGTHPLLNGAQSHDSHSTATVRRPSMGFLLEGEGLLLNPATSAAVLRRDSFDSLATNMTPVVRRNSLYLGGTNDLGNSLPSPSVHMAPASNNSSLSTVLPAATAAVLADLNSQQGPLQQQALAPTFLHQVSAPISSMNHSNLKNATGGNTSVGLTGSTNLKSVQTMSVASTVGQFTTSGPNGINSVLHPLAATSIPQLPPSTTNQPMNAQSIAARQQQLQAQQRELERSQKVLELQRQQLIASMQGKSFDALSGRLVQQQQAMQTNTSNMGHQPQPMQTNTTNTGHNMHLQIQKQHQFLLQKFHATNTSSSSKGNPLLSSGPTMMPPNAILQQQLLQQQQMFQQQMMLQQQQKQASSKGISSTFSKNQNWWICQVCRSKAFASPEEAIAHEELCGKSTRKSRFSNGMAATAVPDTVPMIDNSQRSETSLSSHQTDTTSNKRQPSLEPDGPYGLIPLPMSLGLPSDKDWLTPLHCFVRAHCVEVFTASEEDVATPSKGKRKPIQAGQVGIRCSHCRSLEPAFEQHDDTNKVRERGSVYYPTSIASIYNATMNLLQRHLSNCPGVAPEVMSRYETLKGDDARSGTSKRYWIESALSMGLVDTPTGIRYSLKPPPPLPNLTGPAQYNPSSTGATSSQAQPSESGVLISTTQHQSPSSTPSQQPQSPSPKGAASTLDALVTPDDQPFSTTFSYELLNQMQCCVFTEADRLGKRKGLPPGFPGLACRHCFGGYGSGRFFPSSIKTLSDTSKTLNVLHNHMMRCRKCPESVRDELERLRTSHDAERAKMKFGSQKAFFARIWERLHGSDDCGGVSKANKRQKLS